MLCSLMSIPYMAHPFVGDAKGCRWLNGYSSLLTNRASSFSSPRAKLLPIGPELEVGLPSKADKPHPRPFGLNSRWMVLWHGLEAMPALTGKTSRSPTASQNILLAADNGAHIGATPVIVNVGFN